MTAKQLVEALKRQGVRFEAAGDKLRINAPKGLLNERLKALLTRYKPEIMAVLQEREHPAAVIKAFCFACFKTHGKQGRYQPHTVKPSAEFPGWLEYTCQNCGSRCYGRPQEGGEARDLASSDRRQMLQ